MQKEGKSSYDIQLETELIKLASQKDHFQNIGNGEQERLEAADQVGFIAEIQVGEKKNRAYTNEVQCWNQCWNMAELFRDTDFAKISRFREVTRGQEWGKLVDYLLVIDIGN